ncbi:MAG: hypothetical protein HYS25_13630 [Ignavibacteriales bacterium]|nr:hypothetical protein [Ignavibacteriales bacterium]
MSTEKFDMLNEDQKSVNQILDRSGRTIDWLSERMHMDYETVRYQLRQAKNYRQDFHERVKEIFKKEGLITSNAEVCSKLKDELIDFSTVLTGTVSIISKSIREKIQDRHLTEDEKKVLKDQLRNQLNRVTDEFNDLLLTIDLR